MVWTLWRRGGRCFTTILVADDNLEHRALAQATLEDERFREVLASGGEDAVAKTAAEHPDCILMDIRMPTIDGITACERIRALPDGNSFAIVFVTAQRDVATFDRAEAASGDDAILEARRVCVLPRSGMVMSGHAWCTRRGDDGG